MKLATGGEPRTIYVTDATNEAIGTTGRFMRGSGCRRFWASFTS